MSFLEERMWFLVKGWGCCYVWMDGWAVGLEWDGIGILVKGVGLKEWDGDVGMDGWRWWYR